jgi:hypothetical protein
MVHRREGGRERKREEETREREREEQSANDASFMRQHVKGQKDEMGYRVSLSLLPSLSSSTALLLQKQPYPQGEKMS